MLEPAPGGCAAGRAESGGVTGLSGRTIAITGAARGIGHATARAAAAAGMRVAIGDLDGELSERAAAELAGEAVGLELDVRDRDAFAAFLDEVERRLGPIDVLVNNAGVLHLGEFAAEQPEQTERQIAINLTAVLHGSRLALDRFRPRDRGHLVNVASSASPARSATSCAAPASARRS